MKTLKSLLMLFAMLVSFSAFAVDERVFQRMSGDLFPVFLASLEEKGLLKEDKGIKFVESKVLAEAACDSGRQKHPALFAKYGTLEKCHRIFLARNNLDATMTLDDFRERGQGDGLWLADMPPSATAPMVVEAAKSSALQAPTVVQSQDSIFTALATDLATLKKRFKEIQGRLADEPTKKQLEVLMENTKNDFTSNQSWFEEAKQTFGNKFDALKNEVLGSIGVDQTRLENLESGQKRLEEKVSAGVYWLIGLSVAVVLAVLLAGVSLWKNWNGSREIATLRERVSEHDARFTKVEAKVENGLNLAMGVSFSPLLAQQLSALAPNKTKPTEVILNGKKIMVEIVKGMNGQCQLVGKPIPMFEPSEVGQALRKAAAEGLLTPSLMAA